MADDPSSLRPGTVLEPAVAALEAALHALRRADGIEPASRRRAEAALLSAHSELIQQWFGDGSGQDVLFGESGGAAR